MTTEYVRALKHLEQQANHSVTVHQDAIRRTQERVSEQMAIITAVASEFLSTGIADITDRHYLYDMKYHGLGFGHLGWKWTRFIKDLAIETNRPVVLTWRSSGYGDRTTRSITISKFKYTRPLMSMFMLLECATVRHDSKWFYISLRGTKGDGAYDVWRKQCAEHPEYLRALRIIK